MEITFELARNELNSGAAEKFLKPGTFDYTLDVYIGKRYMGWRPPHTDEMREVIEFVLSLFEDHEKEMNEKIKRDFPEDFEEMDSPSGDTFDPEDLSSFVDGLVGALRTYLSRLRKVK